MPTESVTKKAAMLRCYIVTNAVIFSYLCDMKEFFIGQRMLIGMMETLKKQMESVDKYKLKFRKLNFQEIKELKEDITPLCSVRS